jgi:hypothetical protein
LSMRAVGLIQNGLPVRLFESSGSLRTVTEIP